MKSCVYDEIIKIAGVIMHSKSKFPMLIADKAYHRSQSCKGWSFAYKGLRKPDIVVDIKVVDKQPSVKGAKRLFNVTHPVTGKENWCLSQRGPAYIYQGFEEINGHVVIFINKTFSRATAYLLRDQEKGYIWRSSYVLHFFLQTLLIHYLAYHKQGIFVHASGVKDDRDGGFVFLGKSGIGKSTMARLWFNHKGVNVLNDDRVIITRKGKKFFMHPSIWSGVFNDYFFSDNLNPAPVSKMFFLYQSPHNQIKPVSEQEKFCLLYSCLFPPFWSRELLNNTIDFSRQLVKKTDCFHLGFAKDKTIIPFVKKIVSLS